MDAQVSSPSPRNSIPTLVEERKNPLQTRQIGTSPDRLFLIVAPLMYALYALLTPPFQNFDENQHLYRAWQISSFELVGERRGSESGGELPPGLGQATLREIGSVVPQGERRVVRRPIAQIFDVNTPIGRERAPVYSDFFGAVIYSPIGYLPQVTVVWAGSAADVSVEWIVRLGRLLNVALCIGLVGWALRIVPFGRWPMAIVALSPPMAAGAASFGQDALVNGAGFLLIALGLRVGVDGRWTGPRTAAIAIAGAAISLAKFVYLPLVAVAAFPLPRLAAAAAWLSRPILIGIGAAALVYTWLRVDTHAIVDPIRPWVPAAPEQVSWALAHPMDFSLLIGRTWLTWLPSTWARLYTFGDSTVPTVWSAAVAGTAGLFAILIHGDSGAATLTRSRRAWMLLLFAAVTLLITVAMFITLAPRGAITIEGIQGRYFLPVLPLALIALMRRSNGEAPLLITASLSLVIVAHILTLAVLLTTFYSF